MAERHLHQPEDWELAVVPRNNVSVKPQDPDRRQEFLSNLQAVAEAVFAEIESESIPELPEISEDQWQEVSRQEQAADPDNDYDVVFMEYARISR